MESPGPDMPTGATPVDRCVCLGLPFEYLRGVARAGGLSFAQLRAATGCSTGCSMCEPYVRLMLATGQTRFPIMSEADFRRAGVDPSPGAGE
ncbi:MAG: (2Fe-2S)-binding protein [Phycisphaeraceae bacterium]|nr:(2Fe-2S)-binding protein [Phycisphaeraceae bacterium]